MQVEENRQSRIGSRNRERPSGTAVLLFLLSRSTRRVTCGPGGARLARQRAEQRPSRQTGKARAARDRQVHAHVGPHQLILPAARFVSLTASATQVDKSSSQHEPALFPREW